MKGPAHDRVKLALVGVELLSSDRSPPDGGAGGLGGHEVVPVLFVSQEF